MRPVIVIPSYWAQGTSEPQGPGVFDHSTPLLGGDPELERCLSSLEKVRDCPRIIVLVACPVSATRDVLLRVNHICSAHERLDILVVSNIEAAQVADRAAHIAPGVAPEAISLRTYGGIRNLGLACAAILNHDVAIFLDDDEVVLGEDFVERALYALNQETRQRLPILAKTGYFFDGHGSALASTEGATGICHKWWTKRIEFNRWMKRALSGTRITRSNYACGGCMALSARAFRRIAFDPFIPRGEDLDYLFNLRLFGLEMWFDNQWSVRHLPPAQHERAPRFFQDVQRWYYERAKLAFAARFKEFNQVTPASLMPYPGAWITAQLDERVAKTALARSLFTRERVAYRRIYLRGRAEAQRFAKANEGRYLQFQNFWPSIMDGLWGDLRLGAILEHR